MGHIYLQHRASEKNSDPEGTSANRILNDIQNFFEKDQSNTSDLMRFHTAGDERYAVDLNNAYSYESLTQKPDISVVTLPTEIPMTESGEIDKNTIVARGRLNAKKQKNPNNTETSTYVRVNDIGKDVLLSKNGMIHGIARSQETAFAVMRIGDVLKNSFAVNELNGRTTTKKKTELSYVLLGACRDSENLYAVRSVVSKLQNDVTEIDVYQLGAVKGKKTETPTSALGGAAVTEQSSLISSESPTISIADFLQYVKTTPLANEVFSEDAAKKLGITRSEGSLSGDLRYAIDLNNAYSYESLTQKPDMTITEVTEELPQNADGKISRTRVRAMALSNVRKQNNPKNTTDLVYAHCDDTGTDIRVGSRGLNHGLDRRVEVNAKASLVIGDLIKNAIKVNEVNSLSQGHEGDYVLLSCFSDETGVYGVSIYVDRVSNEVTGMDSIDILYSVNGKKIGTAAPNAEVSDRSPSPTVPTISISQLLEKSNTKFKDIFSKDVYDHFGTEKDTSTKLGSSTRYAMQIDENADHLPRDKSESKIKATVRAGIVKKLGGRRFGAYDSWSIRIYRNEKK